MQIYENLFIKPLMMQKIEKKIKFCLLFIFLEVQKQIRKFLRPQDDSFFDKTPYKVSVFENSIKQPF